MEQIPTNCNPYKKKSLPRIKLICRVSLFRNYINNKAFLTLDTRFTQIILTNMNLKT